MQADLGGYGACGAVLGAGWPKVINIITVDGPLPDEHI